MGIHSTFFLQFRVPVMARILLSIVAVCLAATSTVWGYQSALVSPQVSGGGAFSLRPALRAHPMRQARAHTSALDMMAKKKSKNKSGPTGRGSGSKEAVTLEPEWTFFEGPPSKTEMILPALSTLTVLGIIPFGASVARQFWCNYRITSRRISITGGFQGKETAEIVYRDITEIRYIKRFGGASADAVLFLRDGAKIEARAMDEFPRVMDFIMSKVGGDCRAATNWEITSTPLELITPVTPVEGEVLPTLDDDSSESAADDS